MPPEDFAAEHSAVLAEAMKVYVAKSQVRGQMWLDFPPSDKVRELDERVARIQNAMNVLQTDCETEAVDAIIEDAIDVINYAAFLVKQIRRGHRG